jgi:AAA family ATP:ADP antiporter
MTLTQRLLKPIVDVRERESGTVLLMFLYSFLAIASYTMLKPATRSTFITSLGAERLPYFLLVAGFLIAFIMQGYSKVVAVLPRRWVIPLAQTSLAALMIVFYLLFQTSQPWVSVAFYLFGLILGILLISQFWTLANDIFDPRQAKRVFGFIGGGSSLGGIVGSLVAGQAERIGTYNLLAISAVTLAVCIVLVLLILRRERTADLKGVTTAGEERGVGTGEAIGLLRRSKHLQLIALVIAFAAIGAGVIEQQLNMAAEAVRGRDATDALTAFLGQVQLYTSVLGFVIQVWLTSYIQRNLGIGFALMILPVSLGATGVVMLLNAALWAPSLARVLDTSLRYSVDKTTREVLFLPLPTDIKYQAKPFVDVTVDRMGKAASALLSMVLIADWGFDFNWQQMSYASLVLTALWIFTAFKAKRGYLLAFRTSIEQQGVAPAEVRISAADLSTVETLVEQLADPDEKRVLYAIDLLETLEKRHLVTPLLLSHESAGVRSKALEVMAAQPPDWGRRWQEKIERLMGDADPMVRVAAMNALAHVCGQCAPDLVRPHLDDENPRVVATAASALAQGDEADRAVAEATLTRLVEDLSDAGAEGRRTAASALAALDSTRFHRLLVPLLGDPDPTVVEEALRSARQLPGARTLVVPGLVSLLRDRRLKQHAREVLVGYGEDVVPLLAFFLRDEEEEMWVRRHIPATLARIPSQPTVDVLTAALAAERDGFLRYKVLEALDRVKRDRPDLRYDLKPVEALVLREARRYLLYLSLRHNVCDLDPLARDTLLDRALADKMTRLINRVWLLLGLLHTRSDIAAARFAIERGDARARSSATEYLDNLLGGPARKIVLPLFEEPLAADRVRHANAVLGTRTRGTAETMLSLVHDEDQVVAAAAIHLVAERRMPSFVDDLEHILAHRDVADFFVFEAASWALGMFRYPEGRHRVFWREPLPAVEVAARLARMPLFARTSVDELFRFAGLGRQEHHEAGRPILEAAVPPPAVQLLIEGLVAEEAPDGSAGDIAAPAALAVEEVLQGISARARVRTTTPSVCLVLSVEDWRTLLANSSELVQGLFMTLVEHPAFAGRRVLVRGVDSAPLRDLARNGIRPVEKALVLRQVSLFSGFPAEELVALADVARTERFGEGRPVFGPGDVPAMLLVVDGELSLEADGAEPVQAGPGDTIAIYETLAGIPLGRTARSLRPGVVLRIPHEDLFDLAGQRPDFMRHLFMALLGARQPKDD